MMFMKKRSAAFSLIEILIAMAIIGTMFALMAPNAMKYFGRAKKTATISNLQALKQALQEYYNEIGHFPNKAEGNLNALVKMPKGEKFKTRWTGPYIDGDELPEDGWKQPFIYNAPPVKYKKYKFYELYSIGETGDEDAKNEDLAVGA